MKKEEKQKTVFSEILRMSDNPTKQEQEKWEKIWAKFSKKQKQKNKLKEEINRL